MRIIQMTLDDYLVKAVDGMPKDCAVNCDHLQTVSKGKIVSLITFGEHVI